MAVWTLTVCVMIVSWFLANSQDVVPEGCQFDISQDGNLQLYLNLSSTDVPKCPDVPSCPDVPKCPDVSKCPNVTTWPDMPKCPDLPHTTCKDVKAVEDRTVVTLSDGLVVLCDTKTDGGGWIVIQRRLNQDVDFYRNWTDYKYGFGNISGNFWLGNENIHRLTVLRRYQLRVDFTFNETDYFAVYSSFRILGEPEKYRLEVEGYSGNGGDSLTYHNGMAFTTKDLDNDLFGYSNCATVRHGAWWYNECHTSNLNGLWGSNNKQGLNWYNTTNQKTATSTEMKIRPLD